MPKINKTQQNPHGLTLKEKLTVEDVVLNLKETGELDVKKSVDKFYNASTPQSLSALTSEIKYKENFRAALVDELEKAGVIGADSKLKRRLEEGLDATRVQGDGLVVDYDARLRYVQEINKITGVYAPHRVEKKSWSLNMDMSEDELDEKIKTLQDELS